MPRTSSTDKGDGDSAAEKEERLPEFKTPLEYYLHRLGALLSETYSIATVDLTSHPLPEERSRIWFIGSKDSGFSAEQWKSAIQKLHAVSLALPRHHLRAFFDKFGVTGGLSAEKKKEKTAWHKEASYAKFFAAAWQKAATAKRVGDQPIERSGRPSAQVALQDCSPWMQANIDVYQAILDQLRVEDAAAGCKDQDMFPVADVSQATNRGYANLTGTWGTLCTSTKAVNFSNFQHLGGKGMLSVLGFDVAEIKTVGVGETAMSDLAGNGMSFTQLSQVLLPMLLRCV